GLGTLGFKWPNGVVPVCFQNTSDHPNLQATIQTVLQNNWHQAANLTFTGFGACAASGNQVTVVFAPGTAGACVSQSECAPKGYSCIAGLCDSYRGNTGGAFGHPTVTLISDDTSPNQTHFVYEILHEFGHALGFAHEQQRPDNWNGGVANQCGPAPG